MEGNIFDKPEFVSGYASGRQGDRMSVKISGYHTLIYSLLDRALPGARTLLDIGCATGNVREFLGHKFPDIAYTGSDISEAMLLQAKAAYPEGAFVRADVQCPPFKSESFDVALCAGTLQFAENPLTALALLYRLCKNTLIAHFPVSDTGATRRTTYTSGTNSMPAIIAGKQELLEAITRLNAIYPLKEQVDMFMIEDDPCNMGFRDVDDEKIYTTVLRMDRDHDARSPSEMMKFNAFVVV